MERRHFLKLLAGFVVGGAALAESAKAAPLAQPLRPQNQSPNVTPEPALATSDDIDQLSPEQVRWGRRRGWGFRRGWGRRRRWRRRPWGWRRRPRPWGWRRRHWRRRLRRRSYYL